MSYSNRQEAYVVEQPSAGNPFDPPNGSWSVGLFDCCDDISGCCYAYWCFCCFMCSLADKIQESRLSCCCVPNVLQTYRMKVRSLLQIEGDSCNDWAAVYFCPFCAALQMDTELKTRGIN